MEVTHCTLITNNLSKQEYMKSELKMLNYVSHCFVKIYEIDIIILVLEPGYCLNKR